MKSIKNGRQKKFQEQKKNVSKTSYLYSEKNVKQNHSVENDLPQNSSSKRIFANPFKISQANFIIPRNIEYFLWSLYERQSLQHQNRAEQKPISHHKIHKVHNFHRTFSENLNFWMILENRNRKKMLKM